MDFSHSLRSYRGLITAGCAMSALLAALSGCSGSGSSSSAALATKSAPLNVYVTDDLTAKYSQVVVTLYAIDVSSDNGTTWTNVYSDSSGATIDLASLSSAAQLLSSVTVPAATITNVRLTFADSVMLTPSNGATSQTVTVAASAPNITISGTNAIVTYAAPTPISAGKLANLVVDFKLASFELVGTSLQPAIGPCDTTSFNQKQKFGYIPGTVANLVAGTSFTLDLPRPGNGPQASVVVDLTSSTALTSTTDTTTLADGQSVLVQGTVDPTTGILTAQSISIVSAPGTTPSPSPSAVPSPGASPSPAPSPAPFTTLPDVSGIGTIQSIDTTDGTFVVQVHQGQRFPSPRGGITVATTSTTVFESGQTTSTFSALTTGSPVAIVGTFDPQSGTLTAQDVILLGSGM